MICWVRMWQVLAYLSVEPRLLMYVLCRKYKLIIKIANFTFKVTPIWYLLNFFFSTCNKEWNKKNNKKKAYLTKHENGKDWKGFPSAAAVRLACATQDFHWTLTKLDSCFRQIYFSSTICHTSESCKRTGKLSIDLN